MFFTTNATAPGNWSLEEKNVDLPGTTTHSCLLFLRGYLQNPLNNDALLLWRFSPNAVIVRFQAQGKARNFVHRNMPTTGRKGLPRAGVRLLVILHHQDVLK